MAVRGIREAWEWRKRRRRGQKVVGGCAHFTHKQIFFNPSII